MEGGLNRTLKGLITTPNFNKAEKRGVSFPFSNLLTFGSTATPKINIATALTIPAYYNAVNQIANDIAKLPKGVFKTVEGGREAVDHKIKFLLNKEASPIMDAFIFHFIMELAALHRGNGLAKIVRDPNTGRLEALVFIHPDEIRNIEVIEGKIFYFTSGGVLSQDEVIHIMGFTDNGIYGKGIIQYAAETLGIAKAAQTFTASNFENKGLGYGVVESEFEVKNAKKKVIEDAISSKLSKEGQIKTVMLDEGMKYKPITLNMQEAQLIEQAKFSVLDIARFFNISPRKLKDYSINNYASAYQDATDHVTDTIQPRTKKYEGEYQRKLFTPKEKIDHYIRFNDNYLLRGDLQAKGEFYSKMVFAGVYSRNEVRAFEELNAVDGLEEHLTPVNTKLPIEIQKMLQNE